MLSLRRKTASFLELKKQQCGINRERQNFTTQSIQSGASYLSQDFVMLFHVSCEGLPG